MQQACIASVLYAWRSRVQPGRFLGRRRGRRPSLPPRSRSLPLPLPAILCLKTFRAENRCEMQTSLSLSLSLLNQTNRPGSKWQPVYSADSSDPNQRRPLVLKDVCSTFLDTGTLFCFWDSFFSRQLRREFLPLSSF